jgi:fatty-acyl-CoA synthase
MIGYFRDPESTEACMVRMAGSTLATWATCRMATCIIVGRAKDMIIINGKNHWPQDIEWAVEQLPGFKAGDIAAFSVSNRRRGNPGGARPVPHL